MGLNQLTKQKLVDLAVAHALPGSTADESTLRNYFQGLTYVQIQEHIEALRAGAEKTLQDSQAHIKHYQAEAAATKATEHANRIIDFYQEDREALQEASRICGISVCDANLLTIQRELGGGVNAQQIVDLVASKKVSLAPLSPEEQAAFAREDEQERQRLAVADVEVKAKFAEQAVQDEAEASKAHQNLMWSMSRLDLGEHKRHCPRCLGTYVPAASAPLTQVELDRQVKLRREIDGKPILPTHDEHGVPINRAFFYRASNETLRKYSFIYGRVQIDTRIREAQ